MQASARETPQSMPAAKAVHPDKRRFSFGGRDADLIDIHGWKFDALVRLDDGTRLQKTCFVRTITRGEALPVIFAAHRGSQVFGTGLPLTLSDILDEVGRPLAVGELLVLA